MKDLQTLLAELKQLPAEIGYILGWTGDILAVLTVILSAILYVAADSAVSKPCTPARLRVRFQLRAVSM
jgi:hypothetical protein